MDEVLAGRALWLDADDWVEEWHDLGRADIALHDFLGMSWDEYRLWTERPESLRLIIAARETGHPVEELLKDSHEFAIAARGISETDAEAVATWLRDTGRLNA
jgi:hypothetical protein